MSLSFFQGFTKSMVMTILSEIGDKTFFAAAILAMRYPRSLVLAGCLASVTTTTVLTTLIGMAAPTLVSREWTHRVTRILFFAFGMWALWDAFNEDDDDELAEVEEKLDADSKTKTEKQKQETEDDEKKKKRPFLTQIFSPIFLKAFSITFFGEWGDRSQLATISLAADENALGIVLGGILAQILCTVAAVLGGKSLASQISERKVAFASGVLFIGFGVHSFLSGDD